MHCEKFESRLQDLLDARLRPECDEELQAHAETCPTCRETLVIQEQLFAGLEIWEAPAMSDSLALNVVKMALADRPAEQPVARRAGGQVLWYAVIAAVAASLLLAASPVMRWMLTPAEQPQVAQEQNETKSVPAAPELAVTPVPDIKQPLPTPNETVPISITPQQLAAGGEEVLRNLQQLPEVPVDQSVERIPGLRPIANTFGLAIGVVRRALPGTKEAPAAQDDQKNNRPTKPQAEWLGNQGSDTYV